MKTITQHSKVYSPVHSDQQGLIEAYWSEGRRLYTATRFAEGTRDASVKYVAHYLFYGDKSRRIPAAGYGREKERAERLLRWYRRAFPDHPYILDNVRRCVAWCKRKDVKPRMDTDREMLFKMANDRRSRTAKRRLFEEAEAIRSEGLKVTQSLLVKRTGIYHGTVKKHKHIWEEAYQPSVRVLPREESERRGSRHLRLVPRCLPRPCSEKKVSPAPVVEALADKAVLFGRWLKVYRQCQRDFKKEKRVFDRWCGDLE